MKTLSKWMGALVLGLSSYAMADAPGNVRIDRVDAAGSGCPNGSAYINISPDRQVFTAVFDRFQAVIDPSDPGVGYADRQKRCDLALKVHVPPGWQFSVFKADYEGWYDLQRGLTMTQTSTYHFQGNPRHQKRSVITANVPKNGNFLFTDTIGVSSYEWSACGGPRNLFITAEIRLASSIASARGVAGIDAIEGRFKLLSHFGLVWRRC